jgi:hypothetical protein
MRRPPLHSMLRALVHGFATKAGLDPAEVEAWVQMEKAPPTEIRRKLVETFFPMVDPADFLLPSDEDDATIATVSQLQSPQSTKIRGAVPTEHPWTKALRKKGVSIAEWATTHGVSYSSARSWVQPGSGARKIPREHAAAIKEDFGIPLSAWKQGFAGEK